MTKIIDITKRVYSGGTPDTRKSEYWNGDIKWLSSGETRNNFIFDTDKKITELGVNNSSTKLASKGSIVMACAGQGFTRGQTSYLMDDMYINQSVICIEPDDNKVDGLYLYYFFKNNYQLLRSLSNDHSSRGSITTAMIKDFEVNFPDIDIQKRISNILYSIDQKIELNNKINNNLYELSQKIYNRWFVDFEYPISSNQTYKSNGGSFKEADGLVVPDNFIVNKLDEICDCQNGHAFYKEGYDDSGLMVIDLGNVSLQGNFIYTNADKYIDRNRIPNEKFIVKKNDLVMIMTDRKATMDLLGKTAKIYEDKEYALNQRIYRIRPTINVNYVYSFLNSSLTLEKLKGLALGSVQKYINTNHINDLKIVVPSAEIMNEYSKVVDPVFKRMEENILENRNLEIMRDSLLPKLMNGEIDLDNIEI